MPGAKENDDLTEQQQNDLKSNANIFTYHAPKNDQQERYVALREAARHFADMITLNCPASRERSLAITCLQNTMMWANASIAIHE